MKSTHGMGIGTGIGIAYIFLFLLFMIKARAANFFIFIIFRRLIAELDGVKTIKTATATDTIRNTVVGRMFE